MPFKTRGSGKGPFSARYVSRQRKVGEIILPTMTAGPSGLRIPLNLSPQSSTPKLPPKNLRILTASLFTEVLQILLAWSASHSWHSPTCQGLQAPLSLPPIMPLPPTHTHTHTHTHFPGKPSHLASHRLLSLEHLATFRMQTHLLQMGHQENKTNCMVARTPTSSQVGFR